MQIEQFTSKQDGEMVRIALSSSKDASQLLESLERMSLGAGNAKILSSDNAVELDLHAGPRTLVTVMEHGFGWTSNSDEWLTAAELARPLLDAGAGTFQYLTDLTRPSINVMAEVVQQLCSNYGCHLRMQFLVEQPRTGGMVRNHFGCRLPIDQALVR